MTNSYKTLEWWYHRYPTIFGKVSDNGEITPAYDCPSCIICKETTPHMFGLCTHPDLAGSRQEADEKAITIILDAFQGTTFSEILEANQGMQYCVTRLVKGTGFAILLILG